MAETELALSEQKVSDFNSTVNRLKAEMQEMAANHANDIRREKEVYKNKSNTNNVSMKIEGIGGCFYKKQN